MHQLRKYFRPLRTASFLAPVIISLSSIGENSAFAEFLLQRWDNHHRPAGNLDLTVKLGYYATERNFDNNGSLQIPYELNRYSRVQTEVEGSWGLSRRLSLFGRSGWNYIELDHKIRSSSSFGFTDQTVGANFRVYERTSAVTLAPLAIDIQAQVDFPAYDNGQASESGVPFLGDGSIDVTAGAFLSIPVARNTERTVMLTGGGGYTHRSSGFSAGIPWSLTASYEPAVPGRFFGNIGLGGHYSLLTDKSWTNGSTRSSIATGGSFVVNAINPSIASIHGTLGYRLTRELQGYFTATQAIAGQNAPSGLLASIGVRATLGGGPDSRRSPDDDHPFVNRGFLNYSLDAAVMRSSEGSILVKVGKGRQDGVEVGQVFDIFESRKDSADPGDAVARARVTNVRFDYSDLSVVEVFKDVVIEEGFIAKRLVR